MKGWAGIRTKDEKENQKSCLILCETISDARGQMLSVRHLYVLFRMKIMCRHPFGEGFT